MGMKLDVVSRAVHGRKNYLNLKVLKTKKDPLTLSFDYIRTELYRIFKLWNGSGLQTRIVPRTFLNCPELFYIEFLIL